MEIFYSDDIQGSILRLPAEEAAHCVRVLRHRPGDHIEVIDGRGTLYHCTLLDSDSVGTMKGGGVKNGQKCSTPHGLGVGGASKNAKNDAAALARIDSAEPGWHAHPYRLTLAVCPTKNPDRYEWMAEKATEVGLDTLVPVIGDRSERKVLGKADRLVKILLSAAKQSLKGAVPTLAPAISVRDFIAGCAAGETHPQKGPKTPATPAFRGGSPTKTAENVGESSEIHATLRLIAYCSDEVQPRASIMGLLRDFWRANPAPAPAPAAVTASAANTPAPAPAPAAATAPAANTPATTPAAELPEIVVLIGPEGDFSPEEVRAAMDAGFIPVSLGASRLRTETAAVTAAEAVYLSLLE